MIIVYLCIHILKGIRNLALVVKIALLQTFTVDWILIIKFNTSNISFTI